jgi:hypothetical protein
MSMPPTSGFPDDWAHELHQHVRDAADGFYDERTEHGNAAVELVSEWLGVPFERKPTNHG